MGRRATDRVGWSIGVTASEHAVSPLLTAMMLSTVAFIVCPATHDINADSLQFDFSEVK
jgi:hypothetical protein